MCILLQYYLMPGQRLPWLFFPNKMNEIQLFSIYVGNSLFCWNHFKVSVSEWTENNGRMSMHIAIRSKILISSFSFVTCKMCTQRKMLIKKYKKKIYNKYIERDTPFRLGSIDVNKWNGMGQHLQSQDYLTLLHLAHL